VVEEVFGQSFSTPQNGSVVASSSSRGNCMLAHTWDGVQDLTGWLISIKYDGLRALYDAQDQGFWSRENGVTKKSNRFYVPDFFLKGLPAFNLDGEFWEGRGKFQSTMSIVRAQDKSDRWKQIKYMVFDAPTLPGTFKQRIATLKAYFAANPHPFVEVVDQTPCQNNAQLKFLLDAEEAIGGEGLMAKDPDSAYETGKSNHLLKIKNFFDMEARVIGHTAGKKGRKGTTGALECETIPTMLQVGGKQVQVPGGIKFSVGSGLSAKEWNNPPPKGALITVKFQELSEAKVPRFPSYVGVRDPKYW
jgi:DNA ligase-1